MSPAGGASFRKTRQSDELFAAWEEERTALLTVVDAARAWAAAERACLDNPLDDDAHEAADGAIDSLRAAVAALEPPS